MALAIEGLRVAQPKVDAVMSNGKKALVIELTQEEWQGFVQRAKMTQQTLVKPQGEHKLGKDEAAVLAYMVKYPNATHQPQVIERTLQANGTWNRTGQAFIELAKHGFIRRLRIGKYRITQLGIDKLGSVDNG